MKFGFATVKWRYIQLLRAVAQSFQMWLKCIFGFIPFWTQIILFPHLIRDINDAIESFDNGNVERFYIRVNNIGLGWRFCVAIFRNLRTNFIPQIQLRLFSNGMNRFKFSNFVTQLFTHELTEEMKSKNSRQD